MSKMMLTTLASIGIILMSAPAVAESAPDRSVQRARNITEAKFVEGDATGAPRSLVHNQGASGPDFETSSLAFKSYRSVTKPGAKKSKSP